MGTGSFPGIKISQSVTLIPNPLLVPWSQKGRAIPLLCYGLYTVYRASVPVQGCTVPYCVLQGVLSGSPQKLSVIMYHTTFPTHKMSYLLEFPCLIQGLSALTYDKYFRHCNIEVSSLMGCNTGLLCNSWPFKGSWCYCL